MRINKIWAAGAAFLFIFSAGCRSINGDGTSLSVENAADGMNGHVAREEATIANVKQNGGSVRIIAAGDNMLQAGVLNSAMAHSEEEGSYNFDYCYSEVKDIISAGDVKIINQETLICDNDDHEISGSGGVYNSPSEAGNAIVDLGFNVISMGNNHLLDMGEDGLISCLDYWDNMKMNYQGLITYGAYRNEDDMNNIRTCEVNGVKLAFLAFTDSLGGYSLSEGSETKIILTSDEETMKAQIEAAKAAADAVIVSVHWGTEDSFDVSEDIKQTAKNIIEWGADVIIGTHPHVPQTMEYIQRSDGSEGFVFYSLGNLISSQTYNINLIGEIAGFNVKAAPDGSISIENVEVCPVITHFEDSSFTNLRVIPYRSYTEELCNAHGLPDLTNNASYNEWSMEKIKEIIDTGIPEQFQKLN